MITIDYTCTNSATNTQTVWNMMQDNLELTNNRPILQSDYFPTITSLDDWDRGQGGPLVLA